MAEMQQPGGEYAARAENRHETLRDVRDHGNAGRDRHERDAGACGRVVQHLLEIERQQEELRERERRDDDRDQRRDPEGGAAEDLERQERRFGPPLDQRRRQRRGRQRPRAEQTVEALPQPCCVALVSAYTSTISDDVTESAPATSKCR